MPDARTIFAKIDSLDPRALEGFLAEDATMVFGNGEPLTGPAAIVAASEAFLSTVKAVRHRILSDWTVGSTTIAEAEVTYTRLDGKEVSVPVVSIWDVNDAGLITSYRVFLDLAPVYAP
jgi:ketosteroid isomerase-like protein